MTPATAAVPQTSPLITGLARGGVELIDAIADEWRALCDAGAYDEPFYRPEWIGSYVRAFAPSREVVLVTARSGGSLVAVLPLIKEISTLGGVPARKLRSAGNAHTCRFDLVHDTARAAEAIAAVWQALLDEPGWDVIELSDVPADGALVRLAQHARSEGYATHAAPSLAPPFLDLKGSGERFEALMARVDAKFRANLRRRMRKLETRGAVALLATRGLDTRLERFYTLERAGWKGAEQSAIACDAATRAFYDQVARAAARFGYLCLYSLDSGSATVAMFYGLEHRGRYYLLKTAYDETLRECSPGQLLTHEALRDLTARGGVEFDFLGGAMDWKLDWAPSLRQLTDLYIFRGAAGRALHALRFRLRPAVVRAVRRARA
jgi:CelD/BcsL family acetyltransferase involved in cellulose biosynthesis